MPSLICKKIRIGYFGLEDSFTYLATLRRFGRGYLYKSEPLISKIFEDIINNVIDIAVVPIENSIGGTVYDTVDEIISDRFFKSNVQIKEELYFPIILNLLSKSILSKIQKVYSHPFPIYFCRKWIETNLPEAKVIEVNSTSEAAKMASREKTSAAIASAAAAKNYGLNLIVKNIGGKESNITHFFVLSKSPIIPKRKENKTAIAFSLQHKPGALYIALGTLAKADINLTRIISRPLRGKVGEYKFLVEVEGIISEPSVQKAIKKLEKHTTWINVISSYPTINGKHAISRCK
ncbi:MAG: prephenate dehydratase [Candidatus Firestonebacteria bacterium]